MKKTTPIELETDGADSIPVPQNPDALHAWLRRALDITIPRAPLLDSSDAPFAYLVHAFFEGRFILRRDGTYIRALETLPADAAVWANRGGGKTFLGAVATALDLVFKPGIEVRILGGSLEQSRRMYDHLRGLFEKDEIKHLLDGEPTEKRLRLRNKSRVEILAQSERSVRGTRVQKLRCDEADLFDPALWEAAQLTTRSLPRPGPWGDTVRGSVEVLSTMHVPMGLMWKVVQGARRLPDLTSSNEPCAAAQGPTLQERPSPLGPHASARGSLENAPTRMLFRWGVVDALQHCGDEFRCAPCILKDECGGRAKQRPKDQAGHLSISDAVRMKTRVSKAAWESEMLCLRPKRTDAVFPEFEPDVHVLRAEAPAPGMFTSDAGFHESRGVPLLIGGMDFGVRAPTVVLWALLERGGVLTVWDEYAESNRTLAQHILAVKGSAWGVPAWLGIDPAGSARNDQTGINNATVLAREQIKPRLRRAGVAESLELIRARLQPAAGPPTLFIAARCVKLIESLQRYHYPANRPDCETPEKDGPDHAVDALRYLLINLHAHDLKTGMS